MSGFKLIAIRPLKGCDKKYLRVLKENKIYKFYKAYKFLNAKGFEVKNNEKVNSIAYKPALIDNLYDITSLSNKNINVNISTIVGKNGSGKSTLLELFYALVYLLSVDLKILERPFKEDIQGLADFNELKKGLKLEIFYSIGESIYSIKYDGNLKSNFDKIIFRIINPNKNELRIIKFSRINQKPLKLKTSDFFFSIAVNYSIHGLNSEYIGHWLIDLFHKNDGYQTPLVINPLRDFGNIDINIENYLAQSRLLSNLVDESMLIKNVIEEKTVDKIIFEPEKKKLEVFKKFKLNQIIEKFLSENSYSKVEFFNIVYEKILGVNKPDFYEITHFEFIVQYIIKKLFKIAYTYDNYKKFSKPPKDELKLPELDKPEQFLDALSNDNSHITLKLKQVLNIVRFNLLKEDLNKKIIWKDNKITLSLNELINRIRKAKTEDPSIKNIELVPVAFFNPKIKIKNSSNNSDFVFLSSGELQLVHSIQSILYHIININSVFESKWNRVKYKHINIILDEIELYFHPDLQRKLIKELLISIERLDIKFIKSINILLTTHSPFILSDIQNSNILKLKEGEIHENEDQTFGSNIHNLLADTFFLQEGLIGDFSKTKIEEIIEIIYKKEEDKKDYILELIKIIGEPIIKNRLIDMYNESFQPSVETSLHHRKRELENELIEINKLIEEERNDSY